MLVLVALLQLQAAAITPYPDDSLPMVTLGEALRRATGLDPNYVAAIGQVTNAAWARRSAFSVFILPSITLNTEAARSNPLSFNFVTFQPARTQVTSQVTAKYDLFLGGQKFAELSRSGAELLRVARERVQRAEQQLAVARARVVSGAAVQTDSLQLRLELTRARVGRLVQETALRVARLELGRRVGARGAVDAAPLDTAPAPELPLTLPEAVTQAASEGPQYRVARANERAAGAAFRAKLGQYLPHASLTFNALAYDTVFFHSIYKRGTFTLGVSFPLWDNGQREIALSQARVNRDNARAVREDLERAVLHDVTAAYEGYTSARATAEQDAEALRVARENFRVQQSRYRAGATTILDLLKAQSDLDDADATLVEARYATRLALAGLENILGRRLFPEPEQK